MHSYENDDEILDVRMTWFGWFSVLMEYFRKKSLAHTLDLTRCYLRVAPSDWPSVYFFEPIGQHEATLVIIRLQQTWSDWPY